MNVLLVYAHPEPTSLNGSLKDFTVQRLQAAGHTVQVSDLYAMNWKTTIDADDAPGRDESRPFHASIDSKLAYQQGRQSADIAREQEKLLWADALILQFPLWWFSVPAIMKGWIDRVFANGTVYGAGGKRFDQGGLKGKKAMLSLTTGCFPGMMESDGLLGHRDVVLWHLQHGTFGYSGLQVLQPFVAWSIQYSDAQTRGELLDQYAQRMRGIAGEQAMPSHTLSEFDANWRLLSNVEPRTVGQFRASRD